MKPIAMISPQTTVVPARYSKTMWFDFRWVVTKVTFLVVCYIYMGARGARGLVFTKV